MARGNCVCLFRLEAVNTVEYCLMSNKSNEHNSFMNICYNQALSIKTKTISQNFGHKSMHMH